ncbi:MAG: glycosyltransferase family 2 protein [Bdellovibrionales bacterium]|nr:glycosyltransferase family 2 protein [Bdellovibrionales bacterium]
MISIVIPVYNNQNTLAELNLRIAQVLASEKYEIIYVNDGSSDSSEKLLNSLAQSNQTVKVIHLAKNYGQHPAISAGFEHATGNMIVLMDADLEDAPENLPKILQPIRSGYDICFTIKDEPKNFSPTKFLSLIYHWMIDLFLQDKNPKNLGTFRAFNKKVLEALLSFPERQILYGPLMHHMGFQREFVTLQRPLHSRKSSYSFAKKVKLAINSIISYTDLPHRIFFWTGTLIFILTLFYGLFSVVQYILWGQQLMSGMTLVVMILLIMMSTLMTGLGIIGSYVFRVFQEVLHRPRYLIQDKRNL